LDKIRKFDYCPILKKNREIYYCDWPISK